MQYISSVPAGSGHRRGPDPPDADPGPVFQVYGFLFFSARLYMAIFMFRSFFACR